LAFLNDAVSWLNDILWSNVMIYFCLGVGLLFSILTKFVQIRFIKDAVKQMFAGDKSNEGVSSFQALNLALANRVGTGNIAGTATAIAYGGPGAVFWMWAIAFIGAASAFVESTLAQIYKVRKDGQYRGGPAYFIEKGIGWKWFAVLFAIAAVLAMSLLMPGIQANAIAEGLNNAFGLNTGITGIVLVGLIIIGGVKRIASVAQFVVPFMAIGYMLMALIIIALNITEIPGVISLIFSSAFGADATFGGILGAAISWGVKRGIYSNEAGQGTGAHHAAAAEVSHPAKQGLVQAISVYIDTWLVCSATAFMILFTGMYNVYESDQTTLLQENISSNIKVGPEYTQEAIETVFPGFGAGFVGIALFFFAFTTIIAYYYVAETNMSYLLKSEKTNIAYTIVKIVLLGSVLFGTLEPDADLVWALGDVGLGLMVWLNLIAILILMKPALAALKDYEKQKKQGLDPVYNSKEMGVNNAEYWENGYNLDKKEEAS